MLTSAVLRDASGGTGVQENDGPGTSSSSSSKRRKRVAPRGYSREGAGKFFPLGCRQKGNYFNCGQPRSTKLHPVFLLSLSPLSPRPLFLSTCEAPHADSVSFFRRVSRTLSFSRLFSLLHFVGEHIPSSVAVAAAAFSICTCSSAWLARVSLGCRSSRSFVLREIQSK